MSASSGGFLSSHGMRNPAQNASPLPVPSMNRSTISAGARTGSGRPLASQVAFGIVAGLVVVRQSKVWTTENLPLALRAGIEAPGLMHERTNEDHPR